MADALDAIWYPEPALSSREEWVRAGLKQHRDLSRVRLGTRRPAKIGVAVSDHLIKLADLSKRVDRLPMHVRTTILLYFFVTRPCPGGAPASDGVSRTSGRCETCGAYTRLARSGGPSHHRIGLTNEDVARAMNLLSAGAGKRETDAALRTVARWKKAGIDAIVNDPTMFEQKAG